MTGGPARREDLPDEDVRRFEIECLDHVRAMLAPGAGLRRAMEQVAHKRLISVELDHGRFPTEIAATYESGGQRLVEYHSIWDQDPTPPDPYAEHEAREVATIIAMHIAEP